MSTLAHEAVADDLPGGGSGAATKTTAARDGEAPRLAMPEACSHTGLGRLVAPLCLPSIARRLARMMSVLMLVGLSVLSVAKWTMTAMNMQNDQQAMLAEKADIIGRFIADACTDGEPALMRKLALFEPVRGNTRLTLWRGDGSQLFVDRVVPFASSTTQRFQVPAPAIAGGVITAQLDLDTSHDVHMLRGMAITMAITTVLGVLLVGLAIRWLVQRELRPLLSLAAQTRAISPQRLDQRLMLEHPSEELLPWVEQFNALMQRLQRAYVQLEAFNADVAHELRTPLTTLIGQTELMLSRERDAETLRETLISNLEEMQRMAALVNDMLFLSQSDRGALARRGAPVSLAELAREVAEFHEATLEDAEVKLVVEGDAHLAVDEPLVKRGLSNLIGNATRFATPGTTIKVQIGPDLAVGGDEPDDAPVPGSVRISVANHGPAVAPEHLPRLFDRFFRVDVSRCCDGQQHHGLGLAIVAAIARMHQGRTGAECAGGVTRIGFTVAPGA